MLWFRHRFGVHPDQTFYFHVVPDPDLAPNFTRDKKSEFFKTKIHSNAIYTVLISVKDGFADPEHFLRIRIRTRYL